VYEYEYGDDGNFSAKHMLVWFLICFVIGFLCYIVNKNQKSISGPPPMDEQYRLKFKVGEFQRGAGEPEPHENSKKIRIETHINGKKQVMTIGRDKIVSIHLYPESGTCKVTYTSDNLEETL
jgi:hypothetical protein